VISRLALSVLSYVSVYRVVKVYLDNIELMFNSISDSHFGSFRCRFVVGVSMFARCQRRLFTVSRRLPSATSTACGSTATCGDVDCVLSALNGFIGDNSYCFIFRDYLMSVFDDCYFTTTFIAYTGVCVLYFHTMLSLSYLLGSSSLAC